MGTPIQDQALRIIECQQEYQVSTVIQLFEKGLLTESGNGLRSDVGTVLAHLGMDFSDAVYWMDYFHIPTFPTEFIEKDKNYDVR